MEMSAKDDEVDDGYGIESEEYDPCEYEWIKLMRARKFAIFLNVI